MYLLRWWSMIVLALAMLASAPRGVQGGTPANPDIEERAMAILERVAKVLAQAQRFSVTADIGYDVVQDSGQKIEFGETRTIVLRRPDHLRIKAVNRDGSRRGFVFDGREIAAFDIVQCHHAREIQGRDGGLWAHRLRRYDHKSHRAVL